MSTINSAKVISWLIRAILKNKVSRSLLQQKLDNYVLEMVLKDNTSHFPEFRMYYYYSYRALYMSFFRNCDKGIISPKVLNKYLKTLLDLVLFGNKKEEIKKSIKGFNNKYNQDPPMFMAISPTKRCNLNCTGCYATSKSTNSETLSWTLLNKIIEDAYINMGMRFFVVSGGEPLLYNSENKTILDLAKRWKDCFFLMYTNGLFINEETAAQMAALGNITPAISIEGFEEETNKRRGNGVYQKILISKDNLIKNGVPFGLSVTVTKENINLLLDEKFYEYYFNEFVTTYMWVFQYMPIGRKFSTDLMLSPEQRIELFKMQDKVLIENKFFVADFWNSAILSSGCVACGKPAGYFYINWDGNIMPCAFVPHYIDNVKTLYNSGKTLSDAMFSPLFVEGRKWQANYERGNGKPGNLLMPCFYRDHHKEFAEIAKSTKAKPENQEASDALNSEEYYEAMLKFDEKLEEVSYPVWEERHTKAVKSRTW